MAAGDDDPAGVWQRVYVAPSPIHGEGVFARRDFRRGERVLAIDDSHPISEGMSREEAEERFRHRTDDLAGGKAVILEAPCFTNHSCDPSVSTKTLGGVRYRVALRDIRAGEEITSDYSINSRGDGRWPCNCRSPRCRQWIDADFFRLPVALQRQYLPLLDDWFIDENRAEVERLQRRADA